MRGIFTWDHILWGIIGVLVFLFLIPMVLNLFRGRR